MSGLTLAQFAAMTERAVAADGLEAYQPTLAILETREIVVIADIPEDVPHPEALVEAIQRRGLAKLDIAFGVRTAPGEVTVGRCAAGDCAFETIVQGPDGLKRRPSDVPPWWPDAR